MPPTIEQYPQHMPAAVHLFLERSPVFIKIKIIVNFRLNYPVSQVVLEVLFIREDRSNGVRMSRHNIWVCII